jgi:hypothetical protein
MTHSGNALAVGPLLLLILVAIGLVVLFAASGRRGRLTILLVGCGLACAIAALVVVRVHTRESASYAINTYPGPSLVASDDYCRAMGEVQQKLTKFHEAEARRQAELHESVVRREAEAHEAVVRQYAEVQAQHLAAAEGVAQAHRAAARQYDVAQTRAMAAQPQAEALVRSSTAVQLEQVPAEPWKSVADLGFDTDVHPSSAAAAEALIVQVLKAKDASYPEISVKRIQIWKGDNIGSEVLFRVLTRVQREHPDWQAMPEAAEPAEPLARTDEQAAAIQMELVSRTVTHRAPWDTRREQHGGILRIRLSWRGGSLDRSTSFVEKPWVENASEFISAQPQMRWVVGYSHQDAADSVKARQQAAESAAVQILPAARARLSQVGGDVGVDDRWLLDRIEQRLLQMTDVRDRFTQSLITPFGGQVVREAILVQSPAAVDRAVDDCQVTVRRVRSTWFATIASAAGMCLLICVVALLLNNITKGYYRGRIVMLTGLLLVVGLLVLIKLSGVLFVPYPVASRGVDPPATAWVYR